MTSEIKCRLGGKLKQQEEPKQHTHYVMGQVQQKHNVIPGIYKPIPGIYKPAKQFTNKPESSTYCGKKPLPIFVVWRGSINSSDDLQINYTMTRIVSWYTGVGSLLHSQIIY